jgi:hypothetical protein
MEQRSAVDTLQVGGTRRGGLGAHPAEFTDLAHYLNE